MPLALAASALVGLQTAGPAYAAPAIDGPQTVGDAIFPNVGNGGYDALHYDVDIAWKANGVVGAAMTGEFSSASTRMVARTTGAPLRSFALDFEGLVVDSVTVDGVPAAFERVQDAVATKFKLVVTPDTPVEGEFTTVVTYHGVPVRHVDADGSFEGWNATADGATFLGQPIGSMTGYPHNNTPGDKATYTFSLDIPSRLTSATGTGPAAAASNGELVARTVSDNGQRTTWEWVQQEQMASELALISIGKYDVIEADVTLSDGRVIPEWTFIDSALSEANKSIIVNRRALLGTMLSRFEQVFGPYPGNSTGVVVDTVPSGINYALETQDRSFFPSTNSVAGNTLLHELVHQWYGDNVSPGLWTDIWINEGMGTWGPTYYNSVLAGSPPNPAAVETTYYNSWNATAPTSNSWRTPPGAQTNPANLYGYQTYTRGAQFWEALRTVLRDDDFLRVLQQWQLRYAGQSPRGDALKDLAEEISGHDLDAFWQDWIYDADKPAWPGKYDVSLTSAPGQGTVPGGTAMTYTVSAANVGKVPLEGGLVTVDITSLVDDATIGTLPSEVTRSGNTLTWVVPATAVGATATAAIPVTTTSGVRETVFATASPASLGGACASCGAFEAAPRPTVTGTPAVGVPLTAGTTGWPTGTTFAYQWSVGGAPVAGATEPTYSPVVADLTRTVTVTVTGTAPGFAPTTRASAASPAVAVGTLASSPVPTLSATPTVDVPVEVVTGAWDGDVTFTYEWQVAGAPVGTDASYTPVAADLNRAITVAVTGSKTGFAPVTRTSVATNVVAAAQTLAPTPVLDGAPAVGSAVTVDPGTWDEGTTLAYKWTVDGVVLYTVTGTSYTPRAVDLGKSLSVEVRATKAGYATLARSTAPAVVAPGTLDATPRPTVGGAPVVGSTLSAEPGAWDEGVTLGYRWLVDGVPVAGAVDASWTVPAGALGKSVTVAVTGAKAGYAPVTETSEPVTVGAGTLAATPVPTVSGRARFGSTLTATAGTWDPGVTLGYQWLRNGAPIGGATASTYRTVLADLGARLSVRVTGTKPGYTAVATTSVPTAAIARLAFTGGSVKLTGKAKVGNVLTARSAGFGTGVKVTYTWYAGATVVGTAAKLRLTRATAGKRITVRATAAKPGYVTKTVRSKPTAKVKKR